jgi:sterol 3beta-glucosyltransferase
MKITVLTVGTRGEMQPLVALGLGLQAAGHKVSIATHATFETFARDSGLGFSLINVDIEGFLNSKDGRAILDSAHNLVRTFQIFARTAKSLVLQMGTDCWAACQGTDAILYTTGGFFFAPTIAEKLNVPAIGTYPYPASQPTRAFPNMFSPVQRNLGGSLVSAEVRKSEGWFAEI